MGEAMRRYWIPALLTREIAGPDGPPVRVRLLDEDLVALRGRLWRIVWIGPTFGPLGE
jgi:phthalate 4,5-dioxygenase oxygenase subunit